MEMSVLSWHAGHMFLLIFIHELSWPGIWRFSIPKPGSFRWWSQRIVARASSTSEPRLHRCSHQTVCRQIETLLRPRQRPSQDCRHRSKDFSLPRSLAIVDDCRLWNSGHTTIFRHQPLTASTSTFNVVHRNLLEASANLVFAFPLVFGML